MIYFLQKKNHSYFYFNPNSLVISLSNIPLLKHSEKLVFHLIEINLVFLIKKYFILKEWVMKQEKLKNEEIEITFSYWDGSGHRRSVKMKKGHSIYQFLLVSYFGLNLFYFQLILQCVILNKNHIQK